jgi:hypothetical protein
MKIPTQMIYKILGYSLSVPLFILWLLFCFFLSIIGFFTTRKKITINLDNVKKRETICSVLNNKNLISDQEYRFETEDVATLYDELTFKGYLFVLKPVIFLLKHTAFSDTFILFLVKKWMYVHHFQRRYKKNPNTPFYFLIKTCVLLAKYLGHFLYIFKR